MADVRDSNDERGFTLIELMLVVAIVAILAAVVVPSFMSAGTKAKARTETSAMFSEIAAKEAQFYAENNKYMGLYSAANYVGTSTCPSAIPSANYVFTTSCNVASSAWQSLRIVPSESSVRCQYNLTAGLTGTTFTPPTGFKNSQGALNTVEPTLASSWFYIHAKCDHSGNSGYAEYYTSSVDRKVQSKAEGN